MPAPIREEMSEADMLLFPQRQLVAQLRSFFDVRTRCCWLTCHGERGRLDRPDRSVRRDAGRMHVYADATRCRDIESDPKLRGSNRCFIPNFRRNVWASVLDPYPIGHRPIPCLSSRPRLFAAHGYNSASCNLRPSGAHQVQEVSDPYYPKSQSTTYVRNISRRVVSKQCTWRSGRLHFR